MLAFFIHPINKYSVAAAPSSVSYLFGSANPNFLVNLVGALLFGWSLVSPASLALLLAASVLHTPGLKLRL